ncbi:MAG: glycosyltransferase family 4 protein [Planctomycetota bacterium]|jgi:glycosyltransferase involved in cell wall biosynthesis
MHICFVEDTHLHGGTQIWVSEAMRVFLEKGHDVTLLAPEGGFNAKDAEATAARCVLYDYDRVVQEDRGSRDLWIEGLTGADVAVCTVHPPREGFHCSVFAARCIEEAGLDTVLVPKTGTIVPEYKREFYAPTRPIRWNVVAITNFTREYLVDTYEVPEDRATLVYQGTDLDLFMPSEERKTEALRRYPLPAGAGPVLGNVGSFEHRKGQEDLLHALDRMRERLPGVHLMLVGDGPDEEMLKERVAEMGLENHVTFFPFTREPVYVFEVIDILVLSSRYKEGLPNVLLEAAAMGLPLVSTKLAGVPEIVFEGETGTMVKPGDAQALADGVARLWADPEACRRMGRNGRRIMEERFDKTRQFDAFLEHFAAISART